MWDEQIKIFPKIIIMTHPQCATKCGTYDMFVTSATNVAKYAQLIVNQLNLWLKHFPEKTFTNLSHHMVNVSKFRSDLLYLWRCFLQCSQPFFRCVSTSIPRKFPPYLPPSVTLRSIWDSLPIPLLFIDMFTQCLKTCLHHVYRHVYTMFTDVFTPCLQHVWSHVYTLFEDLFKQC